MRSTLFVVLPALALLAGCPSEVKPPAPPPPAPEITAFTASAGTVAKGDSVTLSWETKNATTVELRDSEKGLVSGVDSAAASGQIEVTVTGDALYVLTATNERGVRATAAAVVTVDGGADKVLFVAAPDRVRAGEKAVLAWSAPGAKSVSLAAGEGEAIDLAGQGSSGTVQVAPMTSTNYVLTVDDQTFTTSVEVAPAVDVFVGTPSPVQPGETLTLSWKTSGAASLTLNDPVKGELVNETDAAKVADGSFAIDIPASTDRGAVLSFELVAKAANGLTTSQPLKIYVGGTVGVTSFQAPALVPVGGTFPVTWTTTGADKVEIFAGGSRVYVSPSPGEAISGNAVLDTPAALTEYTLHAYDSRGTEAVSEVVSVEPIAAPTVSTFTASPSGITNAGEEVVLDWNAPNAREVRIVPLGSTTPIYQATGTAAETGPIKVYPGKDTQYRLLVDNGIGVRAFASTDVTVANPARFTFNPAIAPEGASISVVSHNVVNADSVSGLPALELNAPGDAFIDISTTGTNINYPHNYDGTTVQFNLPQPFTTTLFGQSITDAEISVSINGWFIFGHSTLYGDMTLTLPTDKLEPYAILPFFDDFYSGSGGQIFYQVDQVGSEQRLIIQWDRVEYDPVSSSEVTFQAQVYSGGKIVFAYGPFVGYTGTAPVRGVINGDETGAFAVPGIPQTGDTYTLFGSTALPIPVIAGQSPIRAQVHLTNGGVVDVEQYYPLERTFISEISANPPATVSDGQWFEIENRSLQPFDLSGMTLDFGNGSTHVVAPNTIIPPQSFYVLGQSANAGDGVTVNYVYGNAFTIPPGGAVALVDGTNTITSLSLPQASLPEGASWQLGTVTPGLTTTGSHELGCTAQSGSSYGTNGQLGTPGAANTVCPKYTFTGSIAGNFEPIATTGTRLTFADADDAITTLTLPSPVILDGIAFNELVVSTNGYLSLNPAFTCDTYCWSTPKTELDPSEAPVGLIAPFWADMDLTSHGGVYWERKVPGVTPNDGYTIVSWENVHRFDEPSDNLNFQVKFFDDGNIEFHYGTFIGEDGVDSTTWIENPNGTAAYIFNVDSANTPGISPNSGFRLTAK